MVETISDRNYACFVCSESETKDPSTECSKCGHPYAVCPTMVGQKVDGYTLSEFKGRGYYGLTFKAQNAIGKLAAVKIIPKKLYFNNDKNFANEIKKYVSLNSHANIAELINAGEQNVIFRDKEIEVYFLVMQWIEGKTLRSYIEEDKIRVNDVYSICAEIAQGLQRFEACELRHNDLNADNIMIQILTDDESGTNHSLSNVRAKIIDTGSAIFVDQSSGKPISDLNHAGQHLKDLANAVLKNDTHLPLSEQFFLDSLEAIIGSLKDENPNRGIKTASEFMRQLREKFDQRELLEIEKDERLRTPFEYLNANDFRQNSTLVSRLFTKDFPWVSESIMAPSQQVLLTGPRGCGKTMILKNMRLRTKLLNQKIDPNIDVFQKISEQDDYLGFFVSARLDFGNQFFTTKLPKWAENDDNLLSYFQLLYANEVLDTLALSKSHFGIEFNLHAELEFCELINLALGGEARSMSSALSDVKRALNSIRFMTFNPGTAAVLTGGGFLRRMTEILPKLHRAFVGKKINYLLDDFSLPKIPSHIQKLFLPLIWAPGEGYFFKVSAHSMSTETIDLRDNVYKEHRDFREVSLGREYVNYTSNKQGREHVGQTLRSIIETRFLLAGKEGQVPKRIEEILGAGTASIANDLFTRHEEKTSRSYNYSGWQTLLSLCSGEISYIIDIVGKISEAQPADSASQVSSVIQNKIIRDYAKSELVQLKDLQGQSVNLYEIAQNFGLLSKMKLLGSPVKQAGNDRRAEYTRIEVDLKDSNELALKAIFELISNGVFIDGGLSSSSRGTPTQKLLFRRLFTPAFPTTWNNRDGFNWTQQRFLRFVEDPSRFVQMEFGEKTEGLGNADLFPDSDEGDQK